MSIDPIQREIAAILKGLRSPRSFVGGSTVFNRSFPRRSADMDIYIEQATLSEIAGADVAALREAGFSVDVNNQFYGLVIEAKIFRPDQSTLIEWNEADRERFFPVTEDPVFGWTLHPADLAIQKLVAAASRRAARDILDILLLDRLYAPLSALAIAAPAKLSGASPTAILDRALRNGIGLPQGDYDALAIDREAMPFDIGAIKTVLADAINAASDDIVDRCRDAEVGFVYLQRGSTDVQAPRDEVLGTLDKRGISERGALPMIEPSRSFPLGSR